MILRGFEPLIPGLMQSWIKELILITNKGGLMIRFNKKKCPLYASSRSKRRKDQKTFLSKG